MKNITARVKKLEKKLAVNNSIGLGLVSLHKDGSYSYWDPKSKDLKYLSSQEFDDLTRRHKNTRWLIMDISSDPNYQ